jgi:hypothetical protein
MIWIPPPPLPLEITPHFFVFLVPVGTCMVRKHLVAREGAGVPKSYVSTETLILYALSSFYGVYA